MKRVFLVFLIVPFLVSFKTLNKRFRGLTPNELRAYMDSISTKQASIIKTKKAKKTKNKRISYSKELKELKELKKLNQFKPSFGSEFGTIKTMERFRGIVEGNIKVSNEQVTFKVNIVDNRKIPNGSYIACVGSSFAGKYNYKIIGNCHTLITPDDEYKIQASIKDKNLTEGIKADYVYTGEEEAVIGQGFTAAMSAIVSNAQRKTQTGLGFVNLPTNKNALLTGLVASAASANEKTKEENSKHYVLLAVEDQKEVVVEFNRRFTYEKN